MTKPRREFTASPDLMIRSPLLPYDAWMALAEGLGTTEGSDAAARRDVLDDDCVRVRQRVRALVSRPAVREALFLASPGLFDDLDVWLEQPDSQRGQKVERSLIRYLARMTGRSTPFGLFAGVSPARIGDATSLAFVEPSRYERSTRLDNDYLFALAEELRRSPRVREVLRYRPSEGMYEVAGHIRYPEPRLAGKARTYHLVVVEATDHLRATLKRATAGATRGELAEGLVADDPEIELDEAFEFIDALIDAQLLVCDLGPLVTGREPVEGLLRFAAQLDSDGALETLAEAVDMLAAIDREGLGVDPARYRQVAELLGRLPTRVELSRLFQVDLVKPAPEATLGARVVQEIERGIEILTSLTPLGEDPLRPFRDAFKARYDDREVPLFEALDEELGIGFNASSAPGAEASPLLAGLAFPGAPVNGQQVRFGRQTAHLLSRLHEVIARGAHTLELDARDLDAMREQTPVRLPDGFHCMPRILAASAEAAARGEFRVLMSAGGGPSGARASGRFCHTSEAIHAGVAAHLRAEERLRPHAIFAEIVHLPEGRLGNVLFRPVLRDYEIGYLGLSGADPDKLISIADLTISVVDDRIVLRSQKLGREVVPRMSTAHNFTNPGLGIYRFLCALQAQDGGGFRFSWGPLEASPFLPRVTHGRLIFSRARWRLSAADLEPLAAAAKGAKQARTPEQTRELRARMVAAVQALRDQRKLPRRVVLADGDNELPVDFDNPLSADSFGHLVKDRGAAVLYEELPGAGDLLAQGAEGGFVHQALMSFVRTREPTLEAPAMTRTAPRVAPPGSDWLYAKLYTGTSTADRVLDEVVAPVAREAMDAGLIDRWFFIRYGDPEWHLRVRFHGDPSVLATRVAPLFAARVNAAVDCGLVWRVTHDTYVPEQARYGGPDALALAEQIFRVDSDAVAAIVALLSGDDGMDARWRLAVRGSDMLLDDLGLSLAQKRQIMHRARAGLGREFHVDASFGKQLGTRWKAERTELVAMLERDPEGDARHDYQPGYELLADRSRALAPIVADLDALQRAGRLTSSIADMAWSFVHMYNNRLLRSAARAQELVIYDLLKRYYDERWARRPRVADEHVAA